MNHTCPFCIISKLCILFYEKVFYKYIYITVIQYQREHDVETIS